MSISLIEDFLYDKGVKINEDFTLTMLGNRAVEISGIKSILKINNSEINIKMKKGCVVVLGENLMLKEMQTGVVLIVGNIKKIEKI